MGPRNKLSEKGSREKKAHIEDLKVEAEKRTLLHETTIADIQNKDQIITM